MAEKTMTVSGILEGARNRLGVSQDDLWANYYFRPGARDGRVKRGAFLNYLRGSSTPDVSTFFEIMASLNRQYEDAGLKGRFPEWQDFVSSVQKNLKKSP